MNEQTICEVVSYTPDQELILVFKKEEQIVTRVSLQIGIQSGQQVILIDHEEPFDGLRRNIIDMFLLRGSQLAQFKDIFYSSMVSNWTREKYTKKMHRQGGAMLYTQLTAIAAIHPVVDTTQVWQAIKPSCTVTEHTIEDPRERVVDAFGVTSKTQTRVNFTLGHTSVLTMDIHPMLDVHTHIQSSSPLEKGALYGFMDKGLADVIYEWKKPGPSGNWNVWGNRFEPSIPYHALVERLLFDIHQFWKPVFNVPWLQSFDKGGPLR